MTGETAVFVLVDDDNQQRNESNFQKKTQNDENIGFESLQNF